MQKVQFEYFYNDDSDQYSFYRIPKLLLNKIAARWPAKAVAQFYFY